MVRPLGGGAAGSGPAPEGEWQASSVSQRWGGWSGRIVAAGRRAAAGPIYPATLLDTPPGTPTGSTVPTAVSGISAASTMCLGHESDWTLLRRVSSDNQGRNERSRWHNAARGAPDPRSRFLPSYPLFGGVFPSACPPFRANSPSAPSRTPHSPTSPLPADMMD